MMYVPRAIGIIGDAGSGKDTVADYLCDCFGYVKYSMADPLRAGICAMISEISMDMLLDREKKEEVIEVYGKSPRQMMQTIGTEWGRDLVHEEVWLTQAIAFVAQSDKPVVIPDIRFPNEYAMLTDLEGGVLWRVTRDNTEAVASHSSEGQLSKVLVDTTFDNDGTIPQLCGVVADAITRYIHFNGWRPFEESYNEK